MLGHPAMTRVGSPLQSWGIWHSYGYLCRHPELKLVHWTSQLGFLPVWKLKLIFIKLSTFWQPYICFFHLISICEKHNFQYHSSYMDCSGCFPMFRSTASSLVAILLQVWTKTETLVSNDVRRVFIHVLISITWKQITI